MTLDAIGRTVNGVVGAGITDPTQAANMALSIGPRFGSVTLAPLGTGASDIARHDAVLAACRSIGVPMIKGPGAWNLGGGLLTDPHASASSLVHGNLGSMPWRVSSPTLAPAVRKLYADSAKAPVSRALVWLNYDSLCPRNGYLERPVTIPAGITAIKIELDEVIRGPGGATGDFALQLYDATGVTQVSTTSFTPGAAAADVATAAITVVPGTEYRVRVVCDVSGTQSTFVCGALRVRPTTSSDAFWTSAFTRIDVDGSNLLDSNETIAYDNPRWHRQTAFSRVEIETDATEIRVECYDNIGDYVGAVADNLAVTVDSHPLAPIVPTIGATSINAVSIPSFSDAPHRVVVQAGPQAMTGLTSTVAENRGTFLSAIYVPTCSKLRIAPAAAETIVLYGDSKLAGFFSTIPGRDSLAQMLRLRGYRVISETAGGRALAYDVTTTLTVAACTPFAIKLTKQCPTQVVLGIGRNDFVGATFSGANLATQIGNIADAIHAASPRTQVKLLTWTRETTETDVGGVTWAAERVAIAALATSRSTWCSVLDAGNLWSVAEAAAWTTDGTHPNDAGQERLDRLVSGEQFAWSPKQIAAIQTCVEGDVGQIGDEFGAVTSSGTAPPVVTLSGVSAVPCHLMIQITTGGARGTARFRWSIDGGRSWVARNVLTAATVTLDPIGVTAAFATGTNYSADNQYDADSYIGGWNPIAGTLAFAKVAGDASRPKFNLLAGNQKPGIDCAANTASSCLQIPGLSIAPPYSVWVVAKQIDATPIRCAAGKITAGEGMSLYSNPASPGTMSFNTGTQQGNSTNTLTALTTYIGICNAAGNSYIRANAVLGSFAAGGNAIKGITLGTDLHMAWKWDSVIMAFGLVSAALSVDECLAIEARYRAKYGTA